MENDYLDEAVNRAQDLRINLERMIESGGAGVVTPQRYGFLQLLARQETMKIGTLAEELGCAQSTTSEIVSRMEKAGLVRKTRGKYDQRTVLVEITGMGTEAYKVRRKLTIASLSTIHDKMTVVEKESLTSAMKDLVGILSK